MGKAPTRHTKFKESSLPYYLSIARERTVELILFSRVWALSAM